MAKNKSVNQNIALLLCFAIVIYFVASGSSAPVEPRDPNTEGLEIIPNYENQFPSLSIGDTSNRVVSSLTLLLKTKPNFVGTVQSWEANAAYSITLKDASTGQTLAVVTQNTPLTGNGYDLQSDIVKSVAQSTTQSSLILNSYSGWNVNKNYAALFHLESFNLKLYFADGAVLEPQIQTLPSDGTWSFKYLTDNAFNGNIVELGTDTTVQPTSTPIVGGGGGTNPTATPIPTVTPSPTPTATPISNPNNLVSIDSFAWDMYPNGAAKLYAFYDYSVTYNGQKTIRLDADPYPDGGVGHYGTREVDCIYKSVKPGDHLVWKIKCKTSTGIVNPTAYMGGRVGLDLQVKLPDRYSTADGVPHDYTTMIDGQWRSGNLPSWHYTGTAPEVYLGNPLISTFKAPFNSGEWVQIQVDIIVPTTTYYTSLLDYTSPADQYNGVGYQISSVGLWIDAREQSTGTVWFADPEFYINP